MSDTTLVYTLNSSNVTSNPAGYNNVLQLQGLLPVNLAGYEIALQNMVINYSFPSVQNTTTGFTYRWPSAVPVASVAVTLQENGTYSGADLNAYLQSVMYANLHYLENLTTGEITYFLSIAENSVLYGVQFNSIPLPTTLPSGFTIPVGATWALPAAAANPQITVAAANDFTSLTGLAAGTYPAAPTPGASYSTVTSNPHLSPYSAISVRCAEVDVVQSLPQDQIGIIPINSAYGQPLVFSPYRLLWFDAKNNQTTGFTLTLRDQTGMPLRVLDTYYQATICVRRKIPGVRD